MIAEAATLILAGLNRHIHALAGNPAGTADVAILGSPAMIDDPVVGPTLQNQVLLTLLNVEEEGTLKNGRTTFMEAGGTVVRNRPVHLNLLIMFSANYAVYLTGLERLGQTISYFQGKKRFEPADFPGVLPRLTFGTELSLALELMTLTLEETSFVWGNNGGREMPFAAYRARLVTLEARSAGDAVGEVLDIDIRTHDRFAAMAGGS
jgi:hypothetical protein